MPTNIQWPGLESQPETRALVHDWPDELLAGGANFWDTIAFWRGVDAVLLDLADRPEHLHRIIDRLVTAYLGMLDQMEEQGLLGHSMSVVHCTPAWTDELPHEGFDPARPRAEDLWTMGMAQLFTSARPRCSASSRWSTPPAGTRGSASATTAAATSWTGTSTTSGQIPNVRKISISPWANVDRGPRTASATTT